MSLERTDAKDYISLLHHLLMAILLTKIPTYLKNKKTRVARVAQSVQ